jgi:hypothetical protein
MPGFFDDCGFPIDGGDEMPTINVMSTSVVDTSCIPPDILADGEAVIDAVMSGKKLDPEIARRVEERAARITEEIRRKHGTLNIAVDAIRELRDA